MFSKAKKELELLLIQMEIAIERRELKVLGLTEEEIDGYFEFFVDNYFSPGEITTERMS